MGLFLFCDISEGQEIMSDRHIETFIDKLILLEQKTGAKAHYRIMPPLKEKSQDVITIQKSAKLIAAFIGMNDFTFIIGIKGQGEKVGAHIDLSAPGKDIFVEVDDDVMKFPDTVAATLCHEICHKWLQINAISSPLESDNEILTDITSVFLGFGKIMLNGCRTTNVKKETTVNATQTITETMTAGYLDRDQLALVYRLVCAMRRIPSSDFMRGLNADAALAVRKCDLSSEQYYDVRFHGRETTQETISAFTSSIVGVQRTMANLNKHVTYTKKSLCETVDVFLGLGYRKLESLRKKAVAMTQDNEPDPALCFLQAIKRDFEVTRLRNEVNSLKEATEGFLRHARDVGRHLFRNSHRFPPPSPEMFSVVFCPQDGTKLQLPEDSDDLIATCPTCNYRFAYNTRVLSYQESPVTLRLTLMKRIWNLLKR
jgi:hypothetical protein